MTALLTPQRRLGARGPEVSPLCLGTMMFGDQADAATSEAILSAYFSAGGNFIDTADAYVGGESERVIGAALPRLGVKREDVIIATKVGNPVAGREGSGGLSARWIPQALRESLERLQTDYVDLYYFHLDDETTPLEESLDALAEPLSSGAIRHWAISNYRGWKVSEIVRLADARGLARPTAAQPYYHALNRLIEVDYLPACQHYGIGVVPYSPLARGLLTGKYRGGATPEGSRAARNDVRIMETDFRPAAVAASESVIAHAEATGRTPIGFALRWVLANALIDSVLVGPKSVAQLEGYLAGFAEAPLTPADETAVDAVSAPGGAVGGWADPRYPYRGRVLS